MLNNFIKVKAAVSPNEETENYNEIISSLGRRDFDYVLVEININVDHIEAVQPVIDKEDTVNLYLTSGDRWSVEITEELIELFDLG